MNVGDPVPAGTTDHSLERLVFFSDAVFAIAITLLVIEIHPPHLEYGSSDQAHLAALAQLIPSFIGYVVSFAVIGLFWMGHHRAFALAGAYSPRVLGWNLALLGSIAFIPFVTAYLSANVLQRVPTVLYCAVLLLASILNYRTNRVATSPHMLAQGVSAEAVRQVRQRSIGIIIGAAFALALAAIFPAAGQAGLATIPLWRMLSVRSARRGSEGRNGSGGGT